MPTAERSAVLERPPVSGPPADARALADGAGVHLTARELELLAVLMAREGKVVQRQELYQLVWGGPMPYRDRSVDVLVKRLRQKLTAARPGVEFLHTHYGIGYRFAPEPRPAIPSRIPPSPDSP